MILNDFFLKALFISITIHTLVVCGTYWMKLPEFKKAQQKRMEISYRPPSPKTLDIVQKLIKPAQKLDLQNTLPNSSDSFGVRMAKDSRDLKGMRMYERKPVRMTSEQASRVVVTPIKSDNVNSPNYTLYNEKVRQSIYERVWTNFSQQRVQVKGYVYLTFIIASDGSLKDFMIIDEKTNASQNLKYISTKSLKEAHFPSFLKGMTLPEYTFNIEIEYQVSE
ncbi:MAG: hypothetical protein HQL15_08060 [Candidatus Omnitrophica bacterium]|nr:hypothetical protein [Candidatus Omnitrophota bacterium]